MASSGELASNCFVTSSTSDPRSRNPRSAVDGCSSDYYVEPDLDLALPGRRRAPQHLLAPARAAVGLRDDAFAQQQALFGTGAKTRVDDGRLDSSDQRPPFARITHAHVAQRLEGREAVGLCAFHQQCTRGRRGGGVQRHRHRRSAGTQQRRSGQRQRSLHEAAAQQVGTVHRVAREVAQRDTVHERARRCWRRVSGAGTVGGA